jgi:hypothetical protein
MANSNTDYNFVLDPALHGDLTAVAAQLRISKEEAVRRALELFKHAADAESVELTTSTGQKQAVKLK